MLFFARHGAPMALLRLRCASSAPAASRVVRTKRHRMKMQVGFGLTCACVFIATPVAINAIWDWKNEHRERVESEQKHVLHESVSSERLRLQDPKYYNASFDPRVGTHLSPTPKRDSERRPESPLSGKGSAATECRECH